MASCECDGGHRQDNQSNWDSSRRAFCTGLNGEVEKRTALRLYLLNGVDVSPSPSGACMTQS